jgi:hypothetical protein
MKTSDLDIIFISYDEPNGDFNYADLCNKVPYAKRVHGVKGSDNAHKAAAELADTDWFVTVDGDNIVDDKFFHIEINETPNIQVYGWSGENIINNLRYGNGGLKVWKKDFVLNMRTHEAAIESKAQVDFCWEEGYLNHPTVFSKTVINSTPFQAWRAGFREGVKMLLKDGVKVDSTAITNQIYWHNLHRLKIWSCVGDHIENGIYAMLGARAGSYMTYCTDWNHIEVRDFECLKNIYEEQYAGIEGNRNQILEKLESLSFEIQAGIGLQLTTFDADQSRYFTDLYAETVALGQTYYNKDPVWKSSS